jgi:hypothetical protein
MNTRQAYPERAVWQKADRILVKNGRAWPGEALLHERHQLA